MIPVGIITIPLFMIRVSAAVASEARLAKARYSEEHHIYVGKLNSENCNSVTQKCPTF